MGKVMSSLGYRMSRMNIENRTHKFLDKGTKVVAPKYEGNKLDYERVQQEIPDIAEKLSRKDLDLDDRLKKVFVTSKDRTMAPDPEKINLNRPLPLDTKRQADYDYGHKEPENITPGRCTLKQAIQFISDHQTDAKLWPLPKIVDQYKLKDEEVFNVLHYFSAFKLHVPDPKKQKFIANADKSRTNRQSLLGGKQN